MLFNVSQLLKEPIGATRTYEIDEPGDVLDDLQADRIHGDVDLLRTGRGILAQAELSLNVKQECARCLDDVVSPLTVSFEEEFFPRTDINTGAPIDVPEADAFTIDDRHMLDLTEATRQYALVALPLAPLCKQDCAGLCPQCGTNWNREKCDCEAPLDERWAALGSLLGRVQN
jgi:uncharacterized protein